LHILHIIFSFEIESAPGDFNYSSLTKMPRCVCVCSVFLARVCVFVWFLELWNVLISYLEFGAMDDFHFVFGENFPSVLRNKQFLYVT
jgi:hypothetical protein